MRDVIYLVPAFGILHSTNLLIKSWIGLNKKQDAIISIWECVNQIQPGIVLTVLQSSYNRQLSESLFTISTGFLK